MDFPAEKQLVDLLTELRSEGRQQSGLQEHLVPPDQDAAYRVASKVAKQLGWGVVGWKIAANKPRIQAQLRTDRPIYGRVFSGKILKTPGAVEYDKQCSPIPEPEYMVLIGSDLPSRSTPYTRADIIDSVETIHIGIELAECRFVHDEFFPPLSGILADGSGGGSLVIGPAISDWQNRDISNQRITLSANGVLRREGVARDSIDDPITPVHWLANELSSKGDGLKASQIISTGTLTGMLRPKVGETFIADFGPFGEVQATYA
ncbi:MAG: 2-keto-4-pentenoate hydratase [Alphaproteobacteria bacterium]|jgi:2-keto-4-pentenoate hydratase